MPINSIQFYSLFFFLSLKSSNFFVNIRLSRTHTSARGDRRRSHRAVLLIWRYCLATQTGNYFNYGGRHRQWKNFESNFFLSIQARLCCSEWQREAGAHRETNRRMASGTLARNMHQFDLIKFIFQENGMKFILKSSLIASMSLQFIVV